MVVGVGGLGVMSCLDCNNSKNCKLWNKLARLLVRLGENGFANILCGILNGGDVILCGRSDGDGVDVDDGDGVDGEDVVVVVVVAAVETVSVVEIVTGGVLPPLTMSKSLSSKSCGI